MGVESKTELMSEGRGLLTESEREAIAGDRSDSYRYKTRNYVRSRIEALERDVELLETHAPDLLDDLRAAVCESGAQADAGDTATEPTHTPTAEPTRTRDAPATTTEPESLEEIVDDVAEEVLPGSGAKLEDRREALHAVVEYLREHGSASPQDFQDDVYPGHTAHYTDGKDPARSWWKNCIYKGMRELAERDDRILKADQSGEWSYRA